MAAWVSHLGDVCLPRLGYIRDSKTQFSNLLRMWQCETSFFHILLDKPAHKAIIRLKLNKGLIVTNITLNIDDEVIKKVRKIAIDENSTMTAMIRDFLQSVAEREDPEKEREITKLERSFDLLGRDMGKRTWIREDLYE
jgi:hypothetical protein